MGSKLASNWYTITTPRPREQLEYQPLKTTTLSPQSSSYSYTRHIRQATNKLDWSIVGLEDASGYRQD